MRQVTIFTNHGCSACHAAMTFFSQHGVPFVERNIGDDPEARDELIRSGFRAVPVIRVGDESMVGFSPVKLRKLLGL
jgi:glutaredoxin 3